MSGSLQPDQHTTIGATETAGAQLWMLRTCLLVDWSTRLWAASAAVLATYSHSCTSVSQTLQAAH